MHLAAERFWKEYVRAHVRALGLGAAALLGVELLDLLPPIVLSHLIDSATRGSSDRSFLLLAGGYLGIFIIQNTLRFPLRMGFTGASLRIAGRLREAYANHLLRVPGQVLGSHVKGDLMSRTTNDLETVERGLGLGLLFFMDAVYYVISIPAILFLISPSLTLVALIPIPLMSLVAHVFIRWIGRATEQSLHAFGRMTAMCLENASGAETIRAYGMEEAENGQFERLAGESMARSLEQARLEAGFSAILQVLISLGVYPFLVIGGKRVLGHELSTGQYVAFLQYIGMLAWPLTGFSWSLVLFRKGRESLARLFQVLDLPRVADGTGEAERGRSRGELAVRQLAYARPGRSEAVLREISFHLRPGERVALTGPLGSGKSSLLDLLTRYLEPSSGTIFLDGRDVSAFPLWELRQQFGVVPQHPFLFSDTLFENIRLGGDHESDGNSRVSSAAHAARVTQDGYPEGLGTQVLGKGSSLSGGQRERVALARALVREAPLLLMDDASSALDLETERAIFDALWHLPYHPTILFVTHRASGLRRADRILVLDQGRLVEEGTHEELISRNGVYRALYGSRRTLEDSLEGS